MVNRIDNTHYYEYSKSQNVNLNDKTETSEKFSLNYKKDGLPSEDKEKKDKDKTVSGTAHANAAQAAEQNGVKLELSNRGKNSSMGRAKAFGAVDAKEDMKQASIVDTLRDFVRLAVTAVKDLLYRIWNDPPAKEQETGADIAVDTDTEISESHSQDESKSEISVNTAMVSEEFAVKEPTSEELTSVMRNETARIDREVQQYLKSGNLSQVVSLLTDDGKRVAAHNSTLLTYYDRNGRMIEPSASDKERILHGERSTIKL